MFGFSEYAGVVCKVYRTSVPDDNPIGWGLVDQGHQILLIADTKERLLTRLLQLNYHIDTFSNGEIHAVHNNPIYQGV